MTLFQAMFITWLVIWLVGVGLFFYSSLLAASRTDVDKNTLTACLPELYAALDRTRDLFPLVAGSLSGEALAASIAAHEFNPEDLSSIDDALTAIASAVETTRTLDGWLMITWPPLPADAIDSVAMVSPHSGMRFRVTLKPNGTAGLSAAWTWTTRGSWKSTDSFPQDGRTVILRQGGAMYFARQTPEGLKVRPFVAEVDAVLSADGYWTEIQRES